MGSYDKVVASCGGGWLGRVELLIKGNGDRIRTAPFTDQLTKRTRIDANGEKGGRGGRKKKGGETAVEKPLEDQIKSVEVLWYGWVGAPTDKPVCLLDKPMENLNIRDVVAFSGILYQEQNPGAVKMKINDGVLYAYSMRTLQQHLPQVGRKIAVKSQER